jgi:hypothetical protein
MAEVENGVESAVESAVDNGADNGVADGAPVSGFLSWMIRLFAFFNLTIGYLFFAMSRLSGKSTTSTPWRLIPIKMTRLKKSSSGTFLALTWELSTAHGTSLKCRPRFLVCFSHFNASPIFLPGLLSSSHFLFGLPSPLFSPRSRSLSIWKRSNSGHRTSRMSLELSSCVSF